ncbi:MAG: hypothetical protein AB1757_20760 [Acidobacteriota bacterium]
MIEKFLCRVLCGLFFILALSPSFTSDGLAIAQPGQADKAATLAAINRTRAIVEELIHTTYPELAKTDIQIQSFTDNADYFRTLFNFKRWLFGLKMRYYIKVNPQVFERGAPAAGIRAILSHELGHVYDFQTKNRLRLFGLMRLAGKNYTARFERRTDLQAISRGCGEGLKLYREWLYRNVPAKKLAEKQRNYFSPAEIEAIQTKLKAQPERLTYWLKRVPRSLREIEDTQ